jgi:hypothetical protein
MGKISLKVGKVLGLAQMVPGFPSRVPGVALEAAGSRRPYPKLPGHFPASLLPLLAGEVVVPGSSRFPSGRSRALALPASGCSSSNRILFRVRASSCPWPTRRSGFPVVAHVGNAVQRQDAFHELFRVLHFFNGLIARVRGHPSVTPVFAHFRVQEILLYLSNSAFHT